MPNSFWPHGLYSPWNSPGQNTGVGSHSLLQWIFPTQRLNPNLPHCRRILYCLSYQGSPRILEWVAYPISSRSSQPRNQTRVSCITGRFFTNWAIREAMGGDKCYRQGRVKHDATIFSLGKGLFREYMLERLRAEGLKSGCSLALPLRIFTLNRLLNLSEPQFLYL